jgi:transcriptional regulator with XRE-family HTH domain
MAMTTLGMFIRKGREARGLGLRELAKQLNISPTAISRLENDERRPVGGGILARIFDHLGLDRWEGFRLACMPDPDFLVLINRPSRALADLLRLGRDATDKDWEAVLAAMKARRPTKTPAMPILPKGPLTTFLDQGGDLAAVPESVVQAELDAQVEHWKLQTEPCVGTLELSQAKPRPRRSWLPVKAGEAAHLGVKAIQDGWIWVSPVGPYFVWVQARPRDDGAQYAGGRIGADGYVETYTGPEAVPRPAGGPARGTWLCDRGTFAEAKQCCREDAERRRGR